MTQELFSGAPIGPAQTLVTGWYDSSVHPETGAFALVPDDGSLDALIGEIVQVQYAGVVVFAYVLQAAALPDGTQFALARRAFAGMTRLSFETVPAAVVAVA